MTDNIDLILVNALIDNDSSGANRGFQLGLVYIATYVKTKGYQTKIITGVSIVTDVYQVINSSKNIPLVGFYVTADNVQEVERASAALKNLVPSIHIILGGPEARVDSDRLITKGVCEYVCGGDGEETTLQLLNYLHNKEQVHISQIPNLNYLNGSSKIIKNPAFNLPFNLDHYPIPERELYSPRFIDSGHIITSRGCASECTFCYEGIDKKIRRHSTDRVIQEMKYLRGSYGTRYFSFIDDTFTTDRKKIYSLCEKIKKEFTPLQDVTWYCEAKVSDICKDPQIINTMVDAGLIRMQFGSESGNQRVLDAYKKEITVDQIYKAVEVASKSNITSMFTNYIIGGAHETVDTYRDTLKLATDLMKMAPGVLECAHTFLSPYIGTDIKKNPDKYEINILDSEFITSPSDSYVFAHSKHLSKNQLLEMGQEFYFLITETMTEIVPSLSLETIRRHFYYSNFGLSTTWKSFLSKDPIFKKWGGNIQAGHELSSTNSLLDQLQLIPCRTFDLERISYGILGWGFRNKEFSFETYELYLSELASGKLTLHEISERAYFRFEQKVTREKIINDLIVFYNGLAGEFLITFRRFA